MFDEGAGEYLEVMAGGLGEGVIPLSVGYGTISGLPQGDFLAELIPPMMFGSLVAVLLAGGLSMLGRRRPELTGNGNASKEAMVACARKRWPQVTILDDNQADALLLWQMAMLEYKFLVDAQSGEITPAKAPPPPLTRKLPGKIERAFAKAGRADASEADKSLFLFRLNEAHIPFGKITSARLAKAITGGLDLLREKSKEA